MNNNNSYKNRAFLGAVIPAVLGMIGGAVSTKEQKKANEKQLKKQQEEEFINEGYNEASQLTNTYNNQDYVDNIKRKYYKNGGRMNNNNIYTDRIKRNNIRKKALFGLGVGDVISGVGNILGTVMNKPKQSTNVNKTPINVNNSIPIETTTQPLTQPDNIGNTYLQNTNGYNYNNEYNNPLYRDRLKQFKMGARKCRK